MKGERIAQLELILKAHPEGLRKAELARRINVHRSTIGRYIEELKNFNNVYEENNLIKIEVKDTEEKLALSVYESLALNMGAEMLLTNTEFQSPHLVSGLRKIAMNMLSYAPKIAKNIASLADEAEKKAVEEGFEKPNAILDVLIDAWVSGRMVRIEHVKVCKVKGLDTEVLDETELAPYFIGFKDGDTGRSPISVTGRLRHTTEIITIDINKIKKVVILNETYTIPDNLRVFSRTEVVEPADMILDKIAIKLRVKEKSALNSFRNLSHGVIETEKQENGVYICTFEAENSIELILRIIQCGDAAEILEPLNFRERFISTLQNVLNVYK